jgi:hypothetical protein
VNESNARFALINMLLYPSLMVNVTIRGIAEILKQLRREEETTLHVIDVADSPQKEMSIRVLSDKYAWYLKSIASSETKDNLRDSFCIWGAAEQGETFWRLFFTKAFQTYSSHRDDPKENLDIAHIPVNISKKSLFEEKLYTVAATGQKDLTELEIVSYVLAVVMRYYIHDELDTIQKILERFGMDRLVGDDRPFTTEGAYVPPARAGTRGGPPSISRQASEKGKLTGMLPDNTWDLKLFPTNAESTVTFRKLLNHLNPRYIHFLIHLLTALFEHEGEAPVEAEEEEDAGSVASGEEEEEGAASVASGEEEEGAAPAAGAGGT